MSHTKRPTPLRLSLMGDHEQSIGDRIAYILVRDGISRKALIGAIGLDEALPYFMQDRSPMQILCRVAEYLDVCAVWLATGEGSSDRRKPTEFSTCSNAPEFVVRESALVSGNRAREIHVHNYVAKEGLGR